MAVLENRVLLGRDIMKEVCDLLNIEYDKEKVTRIVVDIPFDDVVTIDKTFMPTRKEGSDG